MATLADLMIKIGVNSDGVDKGAGEIEGKLNKTWGKVKAGAALAGAAAGAALAAGLSGAMELSDAQTKLANQLGGNSKLAGELGAVAGNVYGRGFGDSAGSAYASVQAVWSSGLVPDGDIAKIEELTVAAEAYAKTWGGDVAQATQYASTLIGSGLAKDATHAFDLITVASRAVPVALREDVLEASDEYAQYFRTLGFNGEQAFGLLANASAKGKYGIDKTGDAIKEFTNLATEMNASTTAAYDSIGLDAHTMSNAILAGGDSAQAAFQKITSGLLGIKDPTEQAEAALALFGTPLEDMNKADIPEFLKGMANVGDGLGDVSGEAKGAGDAFEDSVGQRLNSLKNSVQLALIEPLEKAIPYIEKTFGWLSKNSGWVTPLVIGLGAFAAVIGTIVAAMKVWSIVQMVLNLALWTSPITWIVLGIIALVAIIVLIATKTTWFQTAWEAVWGAIKAYYSFVLNAIVTVFKTWWAVFSGFWKGVGRFFVNVWNGIVSGVKGAGNWIRNTWDKVLNFFKSVPGKIRNIASGMWDGIKNAFKSAINWIISKWNGLSFTIPGLSIPGLGSVFGGATLSTPDIPMLADGGIVKASRGGTLALIGEGGRDEAVVPLPRGAKDLAGGGGRAVIEFHSDGTAAGDAVIELARRAIKVRGGDVQVVLGAGGRR